MSMGATIIARNGGTATDRYTITRENGCVLVFAENGISMDAIIGVMAQGGSGDIVDSHLARLARAVIAVGPEENCRALWPKYEGLERQRVTDAYPDMDIAAREWLTIGQHGISSATMFFHLIGVRPFNVRDNVNPTDYPRDADDLSRCRLLLEQVPVLVAGFDDMRKVSPLWARLIDQWGDLCALMDQEAPAWRKGQRWSAPQTNARLAAIAAVENRATHQEPQI